MVIPHDGDLGMLRGLMIASVVVHMSMRELLRRPESCVGVR